MSLSIVWQEDALVAAGQTTLAKSAFQRWVIEEIGMGTGDAAAFELVMTPLAVALAVLFVVGHVTAIPWALAARRQALGVGDPSASRRARKLWLIATLGATGIVVASGFVGWVTILLRL